MLIIEAVTATVPRIVESVDSRRPATTREPTTAIAEMAFVRDIRGVWRSGDTRRITSSPTNVASRRTQR